LRARTAAGEGVAASVIPEGYAMSVKIDLGGLRGEMADAIKEVARFLERETVRRGKLQSRRGRIVG
jgi:hypothetical protein